MLEFPYQMVFGVIHTLVVVLTKRLTVELKVLVQVVGGGYVGHVEELAMVGANTLKQTLTMGRWVVFTHVLGGL